MPRTTTHGPQRGITMLTRPPAHGESQAALTIRIDFGAHGALGPGKVRLMELIGELGSITAAGRAMGMSYRRAWLLIDNLNQMFRQPLVTTQTGGPHGGGAALSDLGCEVVACYRKIEANAAASAATNIEMITAALADVPPPIKA